MGSVSAGTAGYATVCFLAVWFSTVDTVAAQERTMQEAPRLGASESAEESVVDPDPAPRPRTGRRSGFYGRATGAVAMPEDLNVESSPAELPVETGYGGSLGIGYYLNRLRAEGELLFLQTEVDHFVMEGDLTVLSGMFNLFYDHPLADRLSLYAGAGAGVGNIEFDGDVRVVPRFAPSRLVSITLDDTVFAYQFMAGAAYRLADRLTLTGGYRHWRSTEFEFNNAELNPAVFHVIELGLRLDF